ncbi:MAG: hypothetical protein Q9N62_00255 [Ghiorsea sp.]|nr:hypothetical protein [Ghiorsea sp.]
MKHATVEIKTLPHGEGLQLPFYASAQASGGTSLKGSEPNGAKLSNLTWLVRNEKPQDLLKNNAL